MCRLDAEELSDDMCRQLAVPLEALDRLGSMVVDYRGDVGACTAFEAFDIARQLAHGLLVGAWIGALSCLRRVLACGGGAASAPAVPAHGTTRS